MSATKRSAAVKVTPARKAPARRRMTAEEREIAELSARIDRRLEELHAQADAVLRSMSRRSGA
jgi:hypothetical protein